MSKDERVNWLCGCGTGMLAVPESEVPDYCPLCWNITSLSFTKSCSRDGYPIKGGDEDETD